MPGGSAHSTAQRLLPGRDAQLALNRIGSLAAQLLRTPSAQVSLITDVQTIIGGAGLPAGSVGSTSAPEDSLCTVTSGAGAPLVVSDAQHDVRVAHLPPVTAGAVVAYLGIPLVASDGSSLGALCVFDTEARSWSEDEISVLTHLAASVLAELELAALSSEFEVHRTLRELAVQAGGIGTFDWDLVEGHLAWDDRLLEMFGYDADTFGATIASFNDRVHPEDLPQVTEALENAIRMRGTFAAEYRVVVPGSPLRWVAARGRALADSEGRTVRVLGAAYDTTVGREADARVARVLESMNAAFFLLDPQWRFAYVNGRAERLLGSGRDGLLGANLWELFPHAVGSDFERHYREAVETGSTTTFEAHYPEPLNAWFEVQAMPGPDGLSVYFLDITARRAAQDLAERAALRAQLLAEVTAELTETLDPEEAVARLAQLTVPALADWCIVTLVSDDEHAGGRRGLRDIGWVHADPDQRPLLDRYASARLAALTEGAFLMQALRSGQPVTLPTGAAEAIAGVLEPGDARVALLELAPDSAVVIPLRGRGRTVGVLTLFRDHERGPLSGDDFATACDVAVRAGLVLDNGRLYRQQRRLAEQLQRAMLTDPFEPDHMQVVVRYQPATEAAQVGGDWYDAFLQPDGATTLAIGDVIGHDVVAAAAMGQVRTLLRGIAASGNAGPAAVLEQVDQVMQTLQIGTTASVVLARIEQTPEERERSVCRMRWSNAGHPPPMVVSADAVVTPLPGLRADLLLGIDPASPRVEYEVLLERGATVLLFTDGLVERRGQSLDDGLETLRSTLHALALEGVTLDELCDRTMAALLPRQPEDDVAVVAVRLHRQDRPRPVEAGPQRVPPNVPAPPGS